MPWCLTGAKASQNGAAGHPQVTWWRWPVGAHHGCHNVMFNIVHISLPRGQIHILKISPFHDRLIFNDGYPHTRKDGFIFQCPDFLCEHHFSWVWPSDAIWWHRYGSTLAQVIACFLTAPSHYLNQCWFISRFSGIHMRAITQEILIISVWRTNLKITSLKLLPNATWANKLNCSLLTFCPCYFPAYYFLALTWWFHRAWLIPRARCTPLVCQLLGQDKIQALFCL